MFDAKTVTPEDLSENRLSGKEAAILNRMIEEVRASRPRGHRGLWVHLYKITPDLARALIAQGAPNERHLTPSRVASYARDMTNGSWTDSPDPIVLNEQEQRCNANHRLRALVQANVTLKMYVAVDVTDDVIKNLDRGRPRSLADRMSMLNILDRASARRITAIGRSLYEGGFTGRQTSDDAQWSFIEEYKDAIKEVDALFVGHKRGVGRAAVAALFVRVLISHPRAHAALQRAAAILHDTTQFDKSVPGEASIVKLHSALLNSPWKTGGTSNAHVYRLAERAIEAFLKGENLIKIHASTRNRYPLPTDDKSKEYPPLPLKKGASR